MMGLVFLGSAISFLKLVSWGAGATFATQLFIDVSRSETGKKIIKKWGLRVKLVKTFPINDGHTVVLGMTRHGKTFGALHTLKSVKEGVFFFNTQLEKTPNGFVKADKKSDIDDIKNALKKGLKINYVPSTDLEEMQKELDWIIRQFYDGSMMNIILAIDEVHLMKKSTLAQCQRVATTGLRFGIKGMFLSQRGALIDNTLISQSTMFVCFYNNQQDTNYWRNYGFPIDEIMEKINGEKYLFCVYDGKKIEGAYKIG